MVVETSYSGKEAYKCEACGMHYENKSTAERCEEYCRDEGVCNSDITRQSLERQ